MANIEYEVSLQLDALTKATDDLLKLPIKLSFVILIGYLRVKCDSVDEAEKYLDYLRQEEIKEREKRNATKSLTGRAQT